MSIRVIYDSIARKILDVMLAKGFSAGPLHIRIYEGEPAKILNDLMDAGIDTAPIISFLKSLPSLEFNPDDLLLVIQHKRACVEVINEFLSENKRMDLPFEADLQLMEQFTPIKYALEIGAANRALAMWMEVEPDGVVITTARHDKYIQKLTDILLKYPA